MKTCFRCGNDASKAWVKSRAAGQLELQKWERQPCHDCHKQSDKQYHAERREDANAGGEARRALSVIKYTGPG